MGVYKRGSNWCIDYYVDGRRIRETVGKSKTQAEKVLQVRKAEILTGKFQLKDTKKSPLFDIFANEYLDWAKLHKKSWKRDRDSIKHLKQHFGAKRLTEIKTRAIQKYTQARMTEISVRHRTPAPATINREMSCLKKMFSLAIQWGYVSENPARPIKKLKEKEGGRRLTQLEKESLIMACNDTLRPVVAFAMNTGRRLGEILNLRWSDVDLSRGEVILRETKAGDSEVIPINTEAKDLLSKMPRKGDWVFTTRRGTPLKDIRTLWYTAVRKSGIGHCRFHDLRHTWASEMGEHTDLRTLMRLGGWKRPEVPMRYIHPSNKHEISCLERLPKIGHKIVTKVKDIGKVAYRKRMYIKGLMNRLNPPGDCPSNP